MKKDSFCDRGVLCLSGGLDSATLLARHREAICLCVFFNYGSKQNKIEREFSALLAKEYGKEWLEVDARGVFAPFKSALLRHSDEEIELGEYDKKEVSNALVPFRNGIFASVLVGLAESRGCNCVYLGVHAGDHRLYPDCSPEFLNAFNTAVCIYSGKKIRVVAPFLYLTKEGVARFAAQAGLNVDLTYSCYLGGEKHCNECPTCLERKKALDIICKEAE